MDILQKVTLVIHSEQHDELNTTKQAKQPSLWSKHQMRFKWSLGWTLKQFQLLEQLNLAPAIDCAASLKLLK